MTILDAPRGAICGPANVLLQSEPAGDRWCFAEQKRLPHVWELRGDPGPSWWEPMWLCRCSGCGKDRTHFGDGW